MHFRSLSAVCAAVLSFGLLSCADSGVLSPTPEGSPHLSTNVARPEVLISQVYGGGGNSGATYTHDFVELFNPGDQPVTVAGWRVSYTSPAGSSWTSGATLPVGAIIQPGGYFLIQMAPGAGGTTALPTPDATGNAAMGAAAGKVVLARTSATPSGVCPEGVDLVAYGSTANCPTPTATLNNTTAALRKDSGCAYTGSSSADFSTGAPSPRNSGSPANLACGDGQPVPAPVTGNIVINEILADPSVVADADGEWFEVLNRGTVPVDLQGYQIASGSSTGGDPVHTIASSVVLPAGGYAVLARNGDFETNGGVNASYVYDAAAATINLSNSSDWLALRDVTGATVDSVSWSTGPPRGASRAVTNPDADNTNVDGANWFTSTAIFGAGDKGTPGEANSSTGGGGEPGVVASISISINAPTRVPAGYTKPAFATARDGTGTIISPPPAYVWTSSNPGVAKVDNLGYITGVSPGTVTITATAPNGVSSTASFSVIAGDAPTTAVYGNHLEFGIPTGGRTGDDHLMKKDLFALSYSQTRGGPSWVSWNINATQFGPEDRCNCFTADQTLPANVYKVVDFDYRNGGYDRGHMVQSFTRTTTEQENASTFLLTNILPQAANNNQGPWGAFESYANDVVRKEGKEAYVIAGGEYSVSPQTLKNEGKVQVPEFTWKVVVLVGAGKGLADVRSTSDLEVIAVRMPNDTAGARTIRNTPWQSFKTTVDDIEARVGYDLLNALPDQIERMVESGTRAPVANAGGSYTVLEGSSLVLDGSKSSDPDGDALTYAWDFGDGSTGTGVNPTHVYADNGMYTVTLTVSDPFGVKNTATTSTVVVNVAPTVNSFSGQTGYQGETYSGTSGFSDPGADTWIATVDYGDGSGATPLTLTGKTFQLSHVYRSPGTFTVTVTVTDKDGGSGTRTAVVVVRTPRQGIQELQAKVAELRAGGALSAGNANALNATLQAAHNQLDQGNATAAVNQMQAFINQVNSLVAEGKLSQRDGQSLTTLASRVIASIRSL
jgi:DNA/RNA endonuclease G (NUC1)